jgi:hypothetical protein
MMMMVITPKINTWLLLLLLSSLVLLIFSEHTSLDLLPFSKALLHLELAPQNFSFISETTVSPQQQHFFV